MTSAKRLIKQTIAMLTGNAAKYDIELFPTDQQFVFEGDSLSAGFGLNSGEDWPARVASLDSFAGRGTLTNVSTSGDKLADIVGNYATQVFPKRPAATGSSSSTLFVWIGSNDLADFPDPDVYFQSLKDYWQQAKDDGFTIVAFTIVRAGYYDGTMEDSRQRINDLIRSSSVWDKLVDLDPVFTDTRNPAYFQGDNLHLTAGANFLIARIVNSCMRSSGPTILVTGMAPLYGRNFFEATAGGDSMTYYRNLDASGFSGIAFNDSGGATQTFVGFSNSSAPLFPGCTYLWSGGGDVVIGAGFSDQIHLMSDRIEFNAAVKSNSPTSYRGALTGTAYTLTASSAAVAGGTTSPSITLDKAGTYMILARCNVKNVGATYAASQNITLKVRRTNNTAADLAGSSTVVATNVVTTATGVVAVVQLPPVIYTTTNTDDLVRIFAQVGTLPSAGSTQIVEAEILAVQVL